MTITHDIIDAARTDIDVFAREIVGAPLWPHQLEFANSPARIRAVCSGRQAGKSRTLALLALHTAFSQPGSKVLILSAGEEAAKGVLADITHLLSAPLMAGSTVEENRSRITLSTGSEIVCVPASTRQVRGRSIDLLILDEANFMPAELWTAASFTVAARPGSRVVMASSPWTRDHFFTSAWNSGQQGQDGYASFHWPSTESPLMDTELLEQFRLTMTSREYEREVLAVWVDDVGSFFTAAELDDAVADYTMTPPENARGQLAVGGIDWGFSVDANAVVMLGVLDDSDLNTDRLGGDLVYYVPWLEHHSRMQYSTFIDRLVDIARGYKVYKFVSETNGPGMPATQLLRERLHYNRQVVKTWTGVAAVHTSNRYKQSAFSQIKLLLQQGRLVLPRHPELLKQLHALEYEMTPSGNVRISVPERAGHDDVCMALAQAISCTTGRAQAWRPDNPRPQTSPILTTGNGTQIREQPRCWDLPMALVAHRGTEKSDGW